MTSIATQYLTLLTEIDLDYALEIDISAASIPFVVPRTITKYITALLPLLEELVGGGRG
jgi:hypothetical protein